MKKLALLLAIPLVMFAFIAERNSWRPYTLELQAKAIDELKFSADGRYLVINKYATYAGIHDIIVFEVHAHRIAKEIKGCRALFLAGDYLVGREEDERLLLPLQETTVYNLRDSGFKARKIKDFSAYGALPDGKSLLGGNAPQRSAWPPRDLMAYELIDQRTKSQATPPKPYALLPPLPEFQIPKWQSPVFIPSRNFRFLDDQKTMLIYDELPLPSSSYTSRTIFQFWDIKQKKTMFRMESSRLKIFNIATTPSGLAAWIKNGQLEIWNYQTAQRQTVFPLPLPSQGNLSINTQTSEATSFLLALSPDGTLLAGSRSPSQDIFLWDIKTRTLLRTLKGHRSQVLCLAFAPDGKSLASGSSDGSVKLWRIK